MQIVHDEPEAHDLVRRHLERTLARRPWSSSTATTAPTGSRPRRRWPTDSHARTGARRRREPRACVAVAARRAPTRATAARSALLRCELCGKSGATHLHPAARLRRGHRLGARRAPRACSTPPTASASTETVAQAAPGARQPAQPRDRRDARRDRRAHRPAQPPRAARHAQADGRPGRPHARAARRVALDLDHFKQINDRFGHDKGDDVLAAVGACSRTPCATATSPARDGGEEFCILLPDTDLDGALARRREAPRRDRAARGAGGRRRRSPAASASHRSRCTRWTHRPYCASPTARCTSPNNMAATASRQPRCTAPKPRSSPRPHHEARAPRAGSARGAPVPSTRQDRGDAPLVPATLRGLSRRVTRQRAHGSAAGRRWPVDCRECSAATRLLDKQASNRPQARARSGRRAGAGRERYPAFASRVDSSSARRRCDQVVGGRLTHIGRCRDGGGVVEWARTKIWRLASELG